MSDVANKKKTIYLANPYGFSEQQKSRLLPEIIAALEGLGLEVWEQSLSATSGCKTSRKLAWVCHLFPSFSGYKMNLSLTRRGSVRCSLTTLRSRPTHLSLVPLWFPNTALHKRRHEPSK